MECLFLEVDAGNPLGIPLPHVGRSPCARNRLPAGRQRLGSSTPSWAQGVGRSNRSAPTNITVVTIVAVHPVKASDAGRFPVVFRDCPPENCLRTTRTTGEDHGGCAPERAPI